MIPEHNPPRRFGAAPLVQWTIAALLGIIAAGLWLRPGDWSPAAYAQNQPMAGARGVFAFTGQIDHSRYGLFMLDVDQGTIWCYELDGSGGSRKLRLIAARTFIYDRYLQDFNSAAPDFRMVRELVEQQRARAVDLDINAARPADTGPKSAAPPRPEPPRATPQKDDD